jgi:uncharacterized protein YndB with AHSA1/START domain
MSIAPIVRTVETQAPPARAFDIFTRRMAEWWPRGKTIGKTPHAAVVMEPHVGGRWFEIDAAGQETLWGDVLAWEPPRRLVLAWRINQNWTYDPAFLTEVEMTFAPLDDGGTRVTLEHRDLERFGADAATHAATLNSGWPGLLDAFAKLADAETPQNV